MPGLDDVIERARRDPAFRAQLEQDPRTALADYDLTTAELKHIASMLSLQPWRPRSIVDFFASGDSAGGGPPGNE